MSEWISVSEGLPDDMDEYLIVIKHKYPSDKEWQYEVDVASSGGTYLDGFWDTWNDWDEGQELHVTHWMRMPEPPQREAKMTNGDAIRAMTDEELANYVAETIMELLRGMTAEPVRNALVELYKTEVRE